MATHLTLRLAWHNDGWNGRVCNNPEKNTYCVGSASYPGEMIKETRDLDWEKDHAGESISGLPKPPACMYSASTFSDQSNTVLATPPDFFKDDTQVKYWDIPAATACTWPYDAMYNRDDIRKGNSYDYDKRLEYSEDHFKPLENNKSLIFYYANYSNPLSEDDNQRYILVGVARLKSVAPTLFYDNCSEETLKKYKGFVWQRGITSHYPEQGLRLPYHRYIDNPDFLRKFAATPENISLCKYATKQVSDDEALGLLEQLLQSTRIVRDEIKDDSENWDERISWLEGLISEFWKSRGCYPGMPAILEVLGLEEAISGFRGKVESGKELEAFSEVKEFVSGSGSSIAGYTPDKLEAADIKRTILLESGEHLDLLIDILSRCSLSSDQVRAILSDKRESVGIISSLNDIRENPYLLSEQYTGLDANDSIRWSIIDRGMLPSPELSAKPLFKKNSAQRLRSLLLETIRGFPQQTFIKSSVLIEQVNKRIQVQPEWKQNFITEQYLAVDAEFYSEAIYQRVENDITYVYDLDNWKNERAVQTVLDDLLIASDISLKRPVSEEFWNKLLYRDDCNLATKAKDDYLKAIEVQKASCKQIINKRLAAITGGAGTGKSTVVAAIIKAIRKAHGNVGVAVIAPTGKATDRLRSAFNEANLNDISASTIHSILASHGWLNDNMTFRKRGGRQVEDYSAIIIDESSMIDLSLMAALFKAIDWNTVTRLILVGDAAQLPPIGTGKIFADVVGYLRKSFDDNLVELTENLRQLENRATGKGHAILDLAGCFINSAVRGDEVSESEGEAIHREKLITKLHEGGEIDKDLQVVYWDKPEELAENLIEQITNDLTTETNADKSPSQIWGNALKDDVNIVQVLSPVRGELHGTEHLNSEIQHFKSEYWLGKGVVDGLTMFDKVIQIVNRPKSRAIKAYNYDKKAEEEIEIFNGEIGSVTPKGYEWKKLKSPYFRVKDLSVKFSGKSNYLVNYFGHGINKPEVNLELAYAISVHKAQGSEFSKVYFILPSGSPSSQMMELVYTAITRAASHCTIFVENSVESLINAMRPEQSSLISINSSLFEFKPVNDAIANKQDWYEAGKIHEAITGDMVRSKSEVIIANMLFERGIKFWYERPLIADDGTMFLPDFTIQHQGELYFWEHLGMLSKPEYKEHWDEKKTWYDKNFPGQLITTEEGSDLSSSSDQLIKDLLK